MRLLDEREQRSCSSWVLRRSLRRQRSQATGLRTDLLSADDKFASTVRLRARVRHGAEAVQRSINLVRERAAVTMLAPPAVSARMLRPRPASPALAHGAFRTRTVFVSRTASSFAWFSPRPERSRLA